MKVVADTANGMGGLVVPAVFERLPGVELEVMFGELDGTFPNHPADPLQPANQRDLRARVVAGGFDLGLAFDGDADRVFVVDETGNGLSGSTTTAILAAATLRQHPGATILHNLICSRTVPEVVAELGGTPVRTKVGHSFIKQIMAETGAVFGGEHSAHYYFARNFNADSGLIASLMVMAEVGRSGQPLSVVRQPYERYAASGEINTEVDDAPAVIERISEQYADARAGPSRRTHRRLRFVVVQPSTVEHRTAAAPQPRGRRPCGMRRCRRHTARPDHQLTAYAHTTSSTPPRSTNMSLSPTLLEILACPEDKGPLLLRRVRVAAVQPTAAPPLRRSRRHPGDADPGSDHGRRRRTRAADGRDRGERASRRPSTSTQATQVRLSSADN